MRSGLFFVAALSLSFFFAAAAPPLRPGLWKAEIIRPDGHAIVFNFQSKDSLGRPILYVMNGDERLLVDSIRRRGDSLFIQMPFFDCRFDAKIQADGSLKGNWIKNYGDRLLTLPFRAVPGVAERFSAPLPPAGNISGRWRVNFVPEKGGPYFAVGEFDQRGSRVHGTFLVGSGDYRYLEGVVTGDTLKLSAFDGGHAYFFQAFVRGDSLADGRFYAGATGLERWSGARDARAKLPDEDSLTHWKPGQTRLDFRFRSVAGDSVSIADPRFRGKVVVVQILGSWCPNCMDETKFLSDYYNRHRAEGFEVVALAYERTTDFEASRRALRPFIDRLHVNYPVLVTGVTVSDPDRTAKTLPQLDQIQAFPTTLYLDKKGELRRIQTGFSGQATGEHFAGYAAEFKRFVDALLAE